MNYQLLGESVRIFELFQSRENLFLKFLIYIPMKKFRLILLFSILFIYYIK
jgi:hypothetical protein